jgi:hypothetical protein
LINIFKADEPDNFVLSVSISEGTNTSGGANYYMKLIRKAYVILPMFFSSTKENLVKYKATAKLYVACACVHMHV